MDGAGGAAGGDPGSEGGGGVSVVLEDGVMGDPEGGEESTEDGDHGNMSMGSESGNGIQISDETGIAF